MGSVTPRVRSMPECVCERTADYQYTLEQHYEAVRCFLVSLCHDRDLARELTQETYLRAYVHLARYERRLDQPRQWLFTIARCALVDYVRYSAARPMIELECFGPLADPTACCAAEAAAMADEREKLAQAINGLSAVNRALLAGFHLHGEDFGDLARRHGLSRTAARVRVFRARLHLRRRLS